MQLGTSFKLASRLWSVTVAVTPSLTRSINSRAALTPVPPIRDTGVLSSPQLRPNYYHESIKSPADFLKAIGRSCETKISVESWEDFWKKDGLLLKRDGVSVQDRRYCKLLMLEGLNLVMVYSCSDIFCGVWKNIARATQSESLLMNYLLKRQYEGKFLFLSSTVFIPKYFFHQMGAQDPKRKTDTLSTNKGLMTRTRLNYRLLFAYTST